MGSVSIPTALAYIGAAGSAISAGVSAYSSYEQGQATSNADKQKAIAAQIQGQQQQIDERQKMLQALAAQNAGTLGAIGTGNGTSFGANAMRQINQSQNDLMVTSANTSSQVSLLDSAASAASSAGDLGAISDSISGIGNAAGQIGKIMQSSAPPSGS